LNIDGALEARLSDVRIDRTELAAASSLIRGPDAGRGSHGPDASSRLLLGLTGKYPSRAQVRRLESELRSASERRIRGTVRRLSRSRDAKRLRFIARRDIIDVTQYSQKMKMSGIPRVIHALITSDAARGFTLAVWDRGALCPVEMDESGKILYPEQYWRKPPTLPLSQRLYTRLRASRLGFLVAASLEVLGLTRAAASVMMLLAGWRRPMTRADVNLLLEGARLVVPEVPSRGDSECLLAYLAHGGTIDLEVFVHDLLPLSNPEFFERESLLSHVNLLHLLPCCSRIITSSTILRSQIERTMMGLFHTTTPTTVAELPVSMPIGLRRPEEPPFLLFVGGFEERKGLQHLLDALSLVGPEGLTIMVTGEPHPLRPFETALYRRALADDRVRVVGHVSDQELSGLIRCAESVLYLSASEGYGLPILEALASGTPVVCADTPINQYFSRRYGGLSLVLLDRRTVSVRELGRVLRMRAWQDAASIRRDEIPTDTDDWTRRVLMPEKVR